MFLKIDHINVSKYLRKKSVRNHVTIYYRLHLFASGTQVIHHKANSSNNKHIIL